MYIVVPRVLCTRDYQINPHGDFGPFCTNLLTLSMQYGRDTNHTSLITFVPQGCHIKLV